jgi:hypothetical protein
VSQPRDWCYLELKNGDKVKVDKDDYARANEYTWYLIQQRNHGKRQAVTNIKTKAGFKQMTLGRFIMKPRPGQMVYPRRSRETLDYRKENLIVCTMRERQIMLPKRRSACSSAYKGVAWEGSRNKWRAHIDIKGQTRTIGYFSEEIDAARAYNKMAKEIYGDLAYQNNIQDAKTRRKTDER